ncbi:MAG TPA: D-aminoacyl-tRNA deacylase [Burkholderiales bacterium]|nr:D-aminoacyl-tRNA deacylase [Burkholderiales bacterium]
MIGLLQRVSESHVDVDGRTIGAIGPGLLVLICAERGDSDFEAERLLERLLDYRVFADAAGKMNLSVRDVAGGLLLVPQFTLAADTSKGTRASFSPAAPPQEGRRLFEYVLSLARYAHSPVAAGEFGAMMKVSLINDGPVTLWLQVHPRSGRAGDAAHKAIGEAQ